MKFQEKILIVEDEGIVAMDLQDRLATLGYQVVGSTGKGERAIALTEKHRPEIVLMDVSLQGNLDGIETVRRIQAIYRVQIIYLTALIDLETRRRADLTGPAGYISKPFQEDELIDALRVAVDRARDSGAAAEQGGNSDK
jgi:DNA-binding NarL/FixJ family response regulator